MVNTYIFFVLLSFLNVIKVGLIMDGVMDLKLRKKIIFPLLSVFFVLGLNASAFIVDDFIASYAIMFVAVIFASVIMLDAKEINKFLVIVLVFFAVECLDVFFSTYLGCIQKYIVQVSASNPYMSVYSSVVSILFWSYLSLNIKKLKKDFYVEKKSYYYAVFLGVIILNTALLMICTLILGNIEDADAAKIMAIVVSMMVFSMIIEIVIIVITMLSRNKYRDIYRVNAQYLSMQRVHYEKLQQLDEDTRKFRHDIKSHIQCMKTLSDMNNYEELGRYIDNLAEKVDDVCQSITIGNPIIDAVINDKFNEAKKHNIDLVVNGKILGEVKVEPLDLCTIFANSLNNAIEACQALENSQRKIILEVKSLDSYLLINIKNPVRYDVLISEGGDIKTRKKDSRNHGFGIENIKRSVNKYFGEVKIECANHMFAIEIILKIR